MPKKKQAAATSYNYAISQLFSSSLLKKLQDSAYEADVKNLLESCKIYPVGKNWDFMEALEISYNYLLKNYRCEYVYKNEIANQLLLRYHNDNSATLLKELACDESIADIVIINGKAIAYEIKTELDNFERLGKQIESYKCIFDEIYIVTHPGAVQLLNRKLDECVGILVLDYCGLIKKEKVAIDNSHHFEPSKAVLTLRQAELVNAYGEYVGKLPKMGTALIYSFCYNWYLSLDRKEAHEIFYQALKSRRPSSQQVQLINKSNKALKMLFLSKECSNRYCLETVKYLSTFGL